MKWTLIPRITGCFLNIGYQFVVAVSRLLALCTLSAAILTLTGCGTFNVRGQVLRPDQATATNLAVHAPTVSVTTAPVSQNLSPVTYPTSPACQVAFFWGTMPGLCPDKGPVQAEAAFQVYDGGYMLWERVTGSVYVLFNGGIGRQIEENVIANWLEIQVRTTPPSNHVYPIRGFGRVWQHEKDVRDTLGWPLGLEQAYTAQFQSAGSDSRYFYVSLPNGQVIEYNGMETWRVVK
jgi:hypothetical protein